MRVTDSKLYCAESDELQTIASDSGRANRCHLSHRLTNQHEIAAPGTGSQVRCDRHKRGRERIRPRGTGEGDCAHFVALSVLADGADGPGILPTRCKRHPGPPVAANGRHATPIADQRAVGVSLRHLGLLGDWQ